MQDKKKRNRTKTITWVCDKKPCKTVNTRQVPDDIVLNDDVCDYCHLSIHEPILIQIKNDQ